MLFNDHRDDETVFDMRTTKSIAVTAQTASKRVAVVILAFSVAACANSLPLFADWMPDNTQVATGSISSPATALSPELTPSDWDKASAALDNALRPANSSEPVTWQNRATQAHGQFKPVGMAFVRGDDLCRIFQANYTIANISRPALQGLACRSSDGAWQISEVKRAV
jgi:surface antigen